MADSEEEYDRRPRDKFARERDYPTDRSRGRDYGSGDRRHMYPQRGDNYGGQLGGGGMKREARRNDVQSNTGKRSRIDYADTFDPVPRSTTDSTESAPPPPVAMMTFKRFLTTQDDSITDEQAIQKYQEYKLEFKRSELHRFFVSHKDEEWFRLKYHPEESIKKKEEQKTNVQRRFKIFQELNATGWIEKATLDYNNGKYLIRLMDSLVVKLEGGSDEDLSLLVEEELEDEPTVPEENGSNGTKSDIKNSEKKKGSVSPKNETKQEVENEGDDLQAESDLSGGIKKERDEDGALSDSDSEEGRNHHRRKNSATPPILSDEKCEGRNLQMSLHRTSSIFLRNISPSITIAEVEALAKRFPGFLRVGLAEPIPDRKFYRRGWVSFRRDVNIKEICWNLNSIRLRECDLGAIVNRDLTRRVRTVNGVTIHKSVAQNDIRLAAKLVQIYDKKAALYLEENISEPAQPLEMGITSKNPLLNGITEFLIEEASAEEEELLGMSQTASDDEIKVSLVRDDSLLKVLDKVVVYLRLVHSIDYYNHGEYPHEDEMPNRCGMIHVRGTAPSISQWGADSNGNPLVAQQFLNEFIKGFTSRMLSNLMENETISEEEVIKLGKKYAEKEIEAFITANCVELAKDKWLCPLSGKKFKGPEFVRKHLQTKHGDKLEEVRVEVAYFNNYLYDSRRPQNPEIKPLMAGSTTMPPQMDERRQEGYQRQPADNRGYSRYGGGWQDRGGYGNQRSYGQNRGYNQRDFGQSRDNHSQSSMRRNWDSNVGGRRDPREPITYKDLDAPEDTY